MFDIVSWVKTGERGARAEFMTIDLITALLLLNKEPMGRYKLQKELQLTDSNTKSLLNYCKKKKLLKAAAGRVGHSLKEEGRKIVALISKIIVDHGKCICQPFEGKEHYYVAISKRSKQLNQRQQSGVIEASWKKRDIAIAYGGKAILLLEKSESGDLQFPEDEIKLQDYFPNLEKIMAEAINVSLYPGDYLLIVSADTLEVARKSAIITALSFDPRIITTIQEMLE